MKTYSRKAIGAVSALLATTALSVAVPVANAGSASAAISCSTASGEGRDFYSGPRSSNIYDSTFYDGPELSPNVLDTHIPQGLATWPNYYGRGADLLLYTAYHENGGTRNSYIQGINPRTGRRTAIAEVSYGHVGGIAIAGGWAFVSGRGASDGHHTVRKYRLGDLRSALEGRTNYVASVGESRHVHGSSFLATYGGYLYAGKFNKDGRDTMYRYFINPNGTLRTIAGAIEVPKEAQGLVVTGSNYVFSTSHGRIYRSNIYVTRKGFADLDKASPRCFRAPTMSEGITRSGGRIYVLFESGATHYRHSEDGKGFPLNPITNLHWVATATCSEPGHPLWRTGARMPPHAAYGAPVVTGASGCRTPRRGPPRRSRRRAPRRPARRGRAGRRSPSAPGGAAAERRMPGRSPSVPATPAPRRSPRG